MKQSMLVRSVTGDYGLLVVPGADFDPLLSLRDNLKKVDDRELLIVNPDESGAGTAGDRRCAYLFCSSWTGANVLCRFGLNHSIYAIGSMNVSAQPSRELQSKGYVTESGKQYYPLAIDITDFADDVFGKVADQWISNPLGFQDPQRARLELILPTAKKLAAADATEASCVTTILQSLSDGF